MKRIVLITTSFPRTVAGSESAGSFVEDFSAALGRRCRLTVIAPGFGNTVEDGAGYSVHRYDSPERPLSQLKLWSPRDALQILKVMRHGSAVTATVVKAEKPDFVFALWALPSGAWARQATRGTSLPFGIWCLGSDIWSLGRIPVIRRILRSTLRAARTVFADGYLLGDEAHAIAGIDCQFLPSSRKLPIPAFTASRAGGPYRLLFIGRWHPNKGTDLLLEALALLEDADWALIEEVCIHGGGPQEAQVRQCAVALQQAGRPVRAFGYIDKEKAAQALQQCDWLLIPSRIESIPVVFSDAMQSHRPVISMPVGDLTKLVRQLDVGVCADAVDARSFAAAIRTALRQSSLGYCARLEEAARLFDVDGSAERLLQAVDQG